MFLTKTRTECGAPSARRRRRVLTGAAVTAALIVLPGCGGADREVDVEAVPTAEAATTAIPATTATPSVSASPEDAILDAYRAFFEIQSEASAADEDERRELLEPYTADPELSRVLRGMKASEELGQVGYGAAEVDPSVKEIDGDEATITDCQDTSGSGRKDRETGDIKTKGTEEAEVKARMERAPDGEWRVVAVEYQGDSC